MKLKIGLALGGGVNAPLPVNLAKQMVADIVIGASFPRGILSEGIRQILPLNNPRK